MYIIILCISVDVNASLASSSSVSDNTAFDDVLFNIIFRDVLYDSGWQKKNRQKTPMIMNFIL